MKPLFITGIGTGVGKTVWSAIITEALQANYWKPVQAGFDDGTDSLTVKSLISNSKTSIYPEVYTLKMAASPHIAARAEQTDIELNKILTTYRELHHENQVCIIEGAGGLLVPLNQHEFVVDLINKLDARVLLVSRNYLGSINHSLLTVKVLRQYEIPIIGWLFNDKFMDYEDELVSWSGVPKIGSIPNAQMVNKDFVAEQARKLQSVLRQQL